MRRDIAVLDYGMGNLLSVSRAIAHVGGAACVTSDAARVAAADALVIPGVGHFGACMRGLQESGLDGAIRAFVATGRPVFAVCVGMQILLEGSDEDGSPGLGLLPGWCRVLPAEMKVPHIGWNEVSWIVPHPYVPDRAGLAHFYFVHSFAPDVRPGTTMGSTTYGRPFSAAVCRDNVFATQFHPEMSGDAGLAIYERFVNAVASP